MAEYIEIKPPRPAPQKLADWKPALDLMIKDLEELRYNPAPRPIVKINPFWK